MIDAIINTEGGFSLVHDEKKLDECRSIRVNAINGVILLNFDNDAHMELPALHPSMRQMLKKGMDARIIRMNGWSLAKSSVINIEIVGLDS